MSRADELDPLRERMLTAYQAGVAAYSELQALPVWRTRRRRELMADLHSACDASDDARDELAGATGGYRGAPRPLREVLDELGREVYGRRLDQRGRRIAA